MPVRGQRLARLLKLIAMLRGPTCWNARALAEHFGTSRRNVYRDLLVLKMAGVPAYRDADFGEGGSYRIARDWYFPHIPLTDDECINLSVLTQAAESKAIPLLQSATDVRDKILATLPAKQQDLIRDASELFEVLSLGMADHSRCTQIMLQLQKALLTRKQIDASYRSPWQKKNKRLKLQPLRVFLAGQSWYLAAKDCADGKVKLYRLPRFQQIRVTSEPNPVKKEWSLREHLGHAWGVKRGERDYHVEIRFEAEAAELVAEVRWHSTQELEPQKDGSLILRATVSGLDEIVYWILGWGPRATVLKPRELVELMIKLTSQTLGQYKAAGF